MNRLQLNDFSKFMRYVENTFRTILFYAEQFFGFDRRFLYFMQLSQCLRNRTQCLVNKAKPRAFQPSVS